MSHDSNKQLLIKLENLPLRDNKTTDAQLEETLKRVGGKKGVPCERDCDCVMGLVCREGFCTSSW